MKLEVLHLDTSYISESKDVPFCCYIVQAKSTIKIHPFITGWVTFSGTFSHKQRLHKQDIYAA